MPSDARIDRIRASAFHALCEPMPVAVSAQLAPPAASQANSRCSATPIRTIRINARPIAFHRTARNGGVNIWLRAVAAAVNIRPQLGTGVAARKYQAPAGSVSASASAGTIGGAIMVSASLIGRSTQLIAL